MLPVTIVYQSGLTASHKLDARHMATCRNKFLPHRNGSPLRRHSRGPFYPVLPRELCLMSP